MNAPERDWSRPPLVLAVDDEPVVCESIRRTLSDEGYEVLVTTSPREALRLLETRDVNLLLLDIRMPEMDGMEVLRAARDVAPDTEILVITGYATIETAVEAIKLGAFDYLEKPVSPPALLVATARALERRHLLDLTERLRSELETRYRIGNVICASRPMREVMRLVARVAPTSSTVLITGETGTGKDLIARAIHYNSPRRDGPFVVADCASLAEGLLESELFGHVRGAFTGALRDRKGLAETARGGTLFLDEISSISPHVQGNLLRLLQEREIRPVGSDRSVPVDVRLISATNHDLSELVDRGRFREDLFYRLSVFTIRLPPLRERREEIGMLTQHFLERCAQEFGKEVRGIDPRALSVLEQHDWPGNVRELAHTMERAVLLSSGPTILPRDIQVAPRGENGTPAGVPTTVEELNRARKRARSCAAARVERAFVLHALSEADWNVSRAARDTGMARPNFHALMRKLGIRGRRGAAATAGSDDHADV